MTTRLMQKSSIDIITLFNKYINNKININGKCISAHTCYYKIKYKYKMEYFK